MNVVLTLLFAFITGGLLCVIAQILIDKTKLTPARILVTYVVSGAILTAIGTRDGDAARQAMHRHITRVSR